MEALIELAEIDARAVTNAAAASRRMGVLLLWEPLKRGPLQAEKLIQAHVHLLECTFQIAHVVFLRFGKTLLQLNQAT